MAWLMRDGAEHRGHPGARPVSIHYYRCYARPDGCLEFGDDVPAGCELVYSCQDLDSLKTRITQFAPELRIPSCGIARLRAMLFEHALVQAKNGRAR
jgi:hypothetical protein